MLRELNREAGMRILKAGAVKMGRHPSPRQIMCSLKLRGTVRKDCPPYSTQANWMTMVMMRMTKKRGLLKKLANTLI